jgi:REP element-mobilizing transposase RayT
MDEYESLSHSKWECKYHVVFIPKCRRRTLYGELRPHLGEVFRKLALQKESRVEEGHLMPDHVHMMISIPPKYAVSQVRGSFMDYPERHQNYPNSRVCDSGRHGRFCRVDPVGIETRRAQL